MRKLLTGFICVLATLGCNGGGGDTPPPAMSTVSGRVILGGLEGAALSVVPVLDTGALGAPLGAPVQTGADGAYTVDVNGGSGGRRQRRGLRRRHRRLLAARRRPAGGPP